MSEPVQAPGEMWHHLVGVRQDALAAGADPDAAVMAACMREAHHLAQGRTVEAAAHSLAVQAHARGLLQACPPLRIEE